MCGRGCIGCYNKSVRRDGNVDGFSFPKFRFLNDAVNSSVHDTFSRESIFPTADSIGASNAAQS